MKGKYLIISIFCAITFSAAAQNTSKGFKIIPLGVKGGLDESNLSSYLVAPNGSDNFLCLDAGTLNSGLQKVVTRRLLNETSAEAIQKKNIKAYFISHGHMDHLAGLVLNAPNDITKPIYALPSVIDVLKNNYFTWKSWANFASEGDKPILGKYKYQYLAAGTEIEVPETNLFVTAFSLSHVNPYESSAFLVRNNKDYLLYLGDTGADTVEKSSNLLKLWTAVAPLVMNRQLKGIFIEVSFDNSMPDKALFGHLTPKLLMLELNKLNTLADSKLRDTKIFVTHIKPCSNCEENIKSEIATANNLGLQISYPEQGKAIQLNN
jgi:3',5'-cyclic-nucleotide phosphodiesterase